MIAIDLLREPEHLTDGQRCIKVVVHRGIEIMQERLCLCRKLCCCVCRPLPTGELHNHIMYIVQTIKRRLCLMQTLVAEIERTAVMRLENEETNDFARKLLQNILHRKEIILRL